MHIRYVERVSETSKVHPIDMSELVLHMAQSRLVQAEETMAKTRAEVAEVGPENWAQNPLRNLRGSTTSKHTPSTTVNVHEIVYPLITFNNNIPINIYHILYIYILCTNE